MMKTNVITFCFWAICCIGLSQSSKAILPLDELNSPIIHSAYLEKMKNESLLEGLDHLRKKMACYDIRQSDVFDGIESYRVTFSNGKDTSIAIYGPDGEIERTFEYYRDVRIPNPIMGKLIKEYLDWEVLGSKCLVSYSKTGALEEIFYVKMKKEENSIWVGNTIVKN